MNDLSEYLKDIKFLEEPLIGLCPKPLNEMSEQELREFVQKQRTLRDSRQSFKAAVQAAEESGKPLINKKPVANIFAGFEE